MLQSHALRHHHRAALRATCRWLCCCRFKCCIILCDSRWVDPDLDSTNGIQMRLAADMLRFDSMLLMVQLNVRKLLEVRGGLALLHCNCSSSWSGPNQNLICRRSSMQAQLSVCLQEAEYPDINILTEKVGGASLCCRPLFVISGMSRSCDFKPAELASANPVCPQVAFDGLTRFEDRSRLPLGISVNMTAYSARLLTQVRSPAACCRRRRAPTCVSLHAWSLSQLSPSHTGGSAARVTETFSSLQPHHIRAATAQGPVTASMPAASRLMHDQAARSHAPGTLRAPKRCAHQTVRRLRSGVV